MKSLKVCLTHDIDRVYKTYQYLTRDVRYGRMNNLIPNKKNRRAFWTFDDMLSLEARYGAKSTLFFLHETMPFNLFKISEWKLSLGRYSFYDKNVINLIKEVDNEGWEIGLHGSYLSYNNLQLLQTEKSLLEDIVGKKIVGIRQHYLNLQEPLTWKLQKKAGFIYDASLGKTNGIGFLDNRIKPFIDKESGMKVIPLTIMENCLFNKAKRNKQEALRLAIDLMDYSQENDCIYTILWHQDKLNENEFPGYRWVYEEILKESKRRNAIFYLCKDINIY